VFQKTLLPPSQDELNGAEKVSTDTGSEYKRGQSMVANSKQESIVILVVGRE
jgi:hypothetical protein